MDHITNSDALSEAMLLAQSPVGKQLAALLQQSNAQGLRRAMEQAADGRLDEAKDTINGFLATREGQTLLEQLRSNP